MARDTITKMLMLEARYPGFCRQVEAMLAISIPLRSISAALQAQYGERISHTTLWKFKRESPHTGQDRIHVVKATRRAKDMSN